jgi:hypothetical protein
MTSSILKAVNKGKGSRVKIEGRYTSLQDKRNTYLTKAQDYSRMTLPNVFPIETDGATESQHGFSSIGAKVTNHLVNKMVQVLFPAHVPFFKLDFTEEAKLALAAKKLDATALKELLQVATETATNLQSKKASRVAFIEALKQLIIGGNTLLHLPKGNRAQAIPLSHYVLVRDTYGSVVEFITLQSKHLNTFPEELQTLIKKAMKSKGVQADKQDAEDVDLYTWVYRESPDTFVVAQSAYDVLLADKQTVKADELPWIPLSWNLAYGRDYGNGYVEDYSGDMYAAEFLSEALAKGLVLMADVKYMLKAGSITRPEDIFGTPTGEVITGNLDDVGVLQLEKYANYEYINTVLQEIRKSISDGFLMGHATRRQGERVTAYEISQDARELEQSLGGQYSLFGETWQKPYATLLVNEAGLDLPDNSIEPEILTGLDALARAGELEKIRQYTEAMQWVTTWSEPQQAMTDHRIYGREVAASLGIKQPWIKSEKQMQAEAQAMQKAQQEQVVGEEAAKAVPAVIENAVTEE